MIKNHINLTKKLASLSSDNLQLTLRKKRKYKEFIHLIRNGELTYFYKMAKKIKVNRETISRWFYTKLAQKALDQNTYKFVTRLPKQRLTWRDYAKNIDRVLKH